MLPECSRVPKNEHDRSLMSLLARVLAAAVCAAAAPSAVAASFSLPNGALIAGYTNQANASSIVHAVNQGVNVLIWSFIELQGNVTDDPMQEGPNPEILREVVVTLHEQALSVAHLVSVGGWGAPHPDTARTGNEWWAVWRRWDAAFAKLQVKLPEAIWSGFAGVDLDIEGADDVTSPLNYFPPALIELCGTFALAAKRDGYISTMVPPQSYLDCGSPHFDPFGRTWHSDNWATKFTYHGQNTCVDRAVPYAARRVSTPSFSQHTFAVVDSLTLHVVLIRYAPLLAKYGDSYDLVIIQLYEGFSRAGHEIFDNKLDPTAYLTGLARNCSRGWKVDFNGAYGLENQTISVPPSKLIFGLANGWGE